MSLWRLLTTISYLKSIENENKSVLEKSLLLKQTVVDQMETESETPLVNDSSNDKRKRLRERVWKYSRRSSNFDTKSCQMCYTTQYSLSVNSKWTKKCVTKDSSLQILVKILMWYDTRNESQSVPQVISNPITALINSNMKVNL